MFGIPQRVDDMKKKQSKVLIVMPSLSAEDREGMVFAQKLSEAACAAELEPIICGNAEQEAPSASGFRFIPCFSASKQNTFNIGKVSLSFLPTEKKVLSTPSLCRKLLLAVSQIRFWPKWLEAQMKRFFFTVRTSPVKEFPITALPLLGSCIFKRNFNIFLLLCATCDAEKMDYEDKLVFPIVDSGNFSIFVLCAAWVSKKYKIETRMYFPEPAALFSWNTISNLIAVRVFEKLSLKRFCFSATKSIEFAFDFADNIVIPMNVCSPLEFFGKKNNSTANKNALIFYTVNNFSDISSGSSLRVHLLESFLKENNITLQYFLIEQDNIVDNDVSFFNFENKMIDKLIVFIRKKHEKIPLSMEIIQIYLLFFAGRTRKFKKQCAKAMIGHEFIFIEHMHYSQNFVKIAYAARKNIFLTLYDNDADRCSNKFIANIIYKKYIKMLSLANAVATVALQEHVMLNIFGIKNILIHSTSDIKSLASEVQRLSQTRIPNENKRILFVGSRYYPNINAKNCIKNWAKAVLGKYDWHFIIVGGCAERPETTENFKALGIVSNAELIYEYSRADIVIAPLLEGTGSSVKTIEGMGTGKPFLGTSIAFRGLLVADNDQCYIENGFDNFLSRIADILCNYDQALTVAQKGYNMALAYDYRNTFYPYVEFIKGCK